MNEGVEDRCDRAISFTNFLHQKWLVMLAECYWAGRVDRVEQRKLMKHLLNIEFELEYIDSHRNSIKLYDIFTLHFNKYLLLSYVQPTFRPPSSFRPKTNWTGSTVFWSYRQNCCMANNMRGMRRHRWNRLIKVNALSACTTIPAAKCQAEPSKEDPISIQKIKHGWSEHK